VSPHVFKFSFKGRLTLVQTKRKFFHQLSFLDIIWGCPLYFPITLRKKIIDTVVIIFLSIFHRKHGTGVIYKKVHYSIVCSSCNSENLKII
jgi:hypothetical protein